MALRPAWMTVRPRFAPISFRVDRRVLPVGVALIALALLLLVISINYGAYEMTPLDVVQTLLGTNTTHPDYRSFALTVHVFRLPRILLAFMVGAALSVAGAIMQGVTRNALADPYLLGVSGGAALVAVAVIVWLDQVPTSVLPVAAFAGGMALAFLIYALAWRGGSGAPIRLILIGIGLSAMVTALTTLMLTYGNITEVQQAYVWLAGSVHGATRAQVQALGGWLLVLLPLAVLLARALNLLHFGDDLARGFGMRVERGRALLLLVSVALTAAAVAVAGTIGFVGLVAPHITRRLVGPSHEALLPMSALFGGTLLVAADLVGRWVIAPSELPVGIVTALIGAPYFAFLLIWSRKRA